MAELTRTSSVLDVVKHTREAVEAKAAEIAEQEAQAQPQVKEAGKAQAIAFKAAKLKGGESVIYGIGASVNVDLDDEFLKQKSMVTMAHDFAASNKRTFKANHAEEVEMELVESWTGVPLVKSGDTVTALKAGETLADDAQVVGISFEGTATHWFIGVRPSDPAVVEAAKAGEIAGFSWSALVKKEAS